MTAWLALRLHNYLEHHGSELIIVRQRFALWLQMQQQLMLKTTMVTLVLEVDQSF